MQQLLSLTNNKTMNKNFDLVKILKNAPKGTKLWSPICGECKLIRVNEEDNIYPILCKTSDGLNINFTKLGQFYSVLYRNGECVLFPSKENRDWSTFKVSKGHKHFEPFQRVLCYNYCYKIWTADIYSHYDEPTGNHFLVSGYLANDDNDIIPYEGNEDLVGKLAK